MQTPTVVICRTDLRLWLKTIWLCCMDTDDISMSTTQIWYIDTHKL